MNAGRVLVKAGVRFDRIQPAGFALLWGIQQAAFTLGLDLTITCGTEGHTPTDPHTLGEAVDVSVANLTPTQIRLLHTTLIKSLAWHVPGACTVLFEVQSFPTTEPELASIATVNPRATAPHFHLQRAKGTVYGETVNA